MTLIGAGIEPRTNLPQLDGLVPGTTYEKITVHHKINVADVMIMPEEPLATSVVVSEVPQLDAQVTGRGHEIKTFGVVVDAGDGVYVRVRK